MKKKFRKPETEILSGAAQGNAQSNMECENGGASDGMNDGSAENGVNGGCERNPSLHDDAGKTITDGACAVSGTAERDGGVPGETADADTAPGVCETGDGQRPACDKPDKHTGDIQGKNSADTQNKIVGELTKKLADTEKQSREYLDRWQRSAAEFENFKRRTQNDMDRIYTSSAADVIAGFLPVVDSIERAVGAGAGNPNNPDNGKAQSIDNSAPYMEGLVLIERQIKDILRKLDVKPLPGAGEQFDPNLHEAVMHITDEAFGQNVIVEVFQQGYIYKNKIVRHSVVKVAN